jgi:hypothetical protein
LNNESVLEQQAVANYMGEIIFLLIYYAHLSFGNKEAVLISASRSSDIDLGELIHGNILRLL